MPTGKVQNVKKGTMIESLLYAITGALIAFAICYKPTHKGERK
jgi:hypothetical protein